MATSERHREISDIFLEHAEVEFEKGDLLQASQKAWGAVAHYTKAIAGEHGWPHGSHQDIRKNAGRLIELTEDPRQYNRLFGLIENLHVNFYEEEHSSTQVRYGIDDAKGLIEAFKLAELKLSH